MPGVRQGGFGLPPNYKGADVQIFNRVSTANNVQAMTWTKPRGASMVSIICIGGGGGGGGGFTGTAASARGGGAGGGSSGIARYIAPAIFIPDMLALQVGAGGQGVGSGGGTAGSGGTSFVCIGNIVAAHNVMLASAAAGATGGSTGTAGSPGSAGAAATIPVIATNFVHVGAGNFTVIAGNAGAGGGAVAGGAGQNITIPSTGCPLTGGSGGGGTTGADFAGGVFNALTDSIISEGRPQGAAAGSNPGPGGFWQWAPLWGWGGLGGGSSNAGVGGAGGNGAYGCGGGGGGGGTTGGRGGDGGSGLIVIITW